MEKLIAFHGKQSVKDEVLASLKEYYKLVELGELDSHPNSYEEYEETFGIPEVLISLNISILKKLPNDLAKEWPIKFMSAIEPGADLSNVWPQFAVWLLVDEKHGVVRYMQTDEQKSIIRLVVDLLKRGETEVTEDEWSNAASMAFYGVHGFLSGFYDQLDEPGVIYNALQAVKFVVYSRNRAGEAGKAAYYAALAASYKAGGHENHPARIGEVVAQSEKLLQLLSECKPH